MNKGILVLIVVSALLSGCAEKPPAIGKPDRINIAVPYEISSLDPHLKAWLSTYALVGNFYEPLVGTDESNKIQPRLAVTWENPDASTWIFHLQPSARFHDGEKLEAEDVVYTIRRVLNSRKFEVSSYLSDIADVSAMDAHTVKIRTKTPLAIFLNKMNNIHIVPRGSTEEMLGSTVNGTGPYKLVEWKKGEFVRMIRNEQYWGKKPAVRHVTYFLNRTPELAVRELMSGKCQFAQYNFKRLETVVQATGKFQILRKDNYYLKYLSYDVSRDETPYCKVKPNPFKNKLVRHAIQMAIDRNRLIERLPTYAVPATQPVPPFVFGFNASIEPSRYDLEGARALMKKAGLENGFDVTFFSRQILQETGVLLQEQLAKIGIRMQLQVFPDSEFFGKLDRQDATFFLTRVGATVGDASDILEPQMHTKDPNGSYGIRNYIGYSNPEVDQIIRDSAGILKIEERREALERTMAILMEDLPWIPLYIDQDVYALENAFTWKPRHDSNVFAFEIEVK